MTTRWLSLATLLLSALPVVADDWTQWRGPNRTDKSNEKGLLKTWPEKGPRLIWTFDNAGSGYSGPAIVGNRLYTMGTRDNSECVLALAADSGKELWVCPFGTIFSEGHGKGPRATPTVDGELLYVIGGQSDLVCVEAASGKKVWSKNLRDDFDGELMSGWGYCESPLVDGDKVICTPGGPKGAMVALDKKTGKEIWRTKDLKDQCGYSSVIVADVFGVRQYIQVTAKAVVGVAANDGKLLWRYEPEIKLRTAVIPTPIYYDACVYMSAGYGAGCECIRLEQDGGVFRSKMLYSNKVMTNHHGGVVLVDGHIYGYSESGRWTCQDFKTGKVVWNSSKLDKGSLTYADGHLICYGEGKGAVVLVEATPTAWKEDGRFSLPKESKIRAASGRFWTHPVVANGKLYLRDQDLIFCFDVKDQIAQKNLEIMKRLSVFE